MKHLLWIVALVAIVITCKSCDKGSDSDKMLAYARTRYAKLFGDTLQVKALVEKYHQTCFDEAYSYGSRRKRGSVDQDEYERLMFEKLRAKLGAPRAPAPAR